LSRSFKENLDAAQGNLKPGEVGIVSEVEDKTTNASQNLYHVQAAGGDTWWFSNDAIQLKRCRDQASCTQLLDAELTFQTDLRAACESSSAVAALACARWNNHLMSVNPG